MQNLLSLLLLLILSNCSQTSPDNLEYIELQSKIEVTIESVEVFKQNSIKKIISYGDLRLIIVETPTEREYVSIDSNGKSEVDSVKNYLVKNFYIFNNNEPVGLKYQSLKGDTPVKVIKDSILNSLNIGLANIKSNEKSSGILTEKIYDDNNELVSEKFVLRNESKIDSIYRYYDSKLKTVKFSLAPLLESKHQTKLSKLIYVFIDEKTGEKSKASFVIRKIDLKFEEAKFLNLFKKFESDI